MHRLSGISAPTSTLYSLKELVRSLVATKCKALFTCEPLLETALQAAEQVGIPRNWIFLIDVPDDENDRRKHRDIKTVDELIDIGENGRCEKLEVLRWSAGQGARQPAFLCSSSGTSGLPVGVSSSSTCARWLFFTKGHVEKCHRYTPQHHYQLHSVFSNLSWKETKSS